MRRLLGWTLALSLALLCSCQGFGLRTGAGCPVELADAGTIEPGLRAQGTMRVTGGEIATTLSFAVEQVDETLTLVGFTPFGTRAFAIRQVGTELRVDDFVGRRMGFEPVWLADALHRAYFIVPPADTGETAGGRRWQWGGEEIAERLGPDGAPRLRTFSHAGAGSTEVVAVEYSRSADAGTGVEVDNPWCGYHARLLLERDDGSRSRSEE